VPADLIKKMVAESPAQFAPQGPKEPAPEPGQQKPKQKR
jgi:hypothetical protein